MIEIYTDGSCLTNPGNGGWAAIINEDGKIKKISGSEKNTTNNRMELLAPINALKEMDASLEINIYTDSQYVKLGITEWINKWIINNWQTSKKEDVKNKDLSHLRNHILVNRGNFTGRLKIFVSLSLFLFFSFLF